MSDTEASSTDESSSTDRDDSSSSSSKRKPAFVRTEECQEEMAECLRSKNTNVLSVKKVHNKLKSLANVFQNMLDSMENAEKEKVRQIKEFEGVTKESLNVPDGDVKETMWIMFKELEKEKEDHRKTIEECQEEIYRRLDEIGAYCAGLMSDFEEKRRDWKAYKIHKKDFDETHAFEEGLDEAWEMAHADSD